MGREGHKRYRGGGAMNCCACGGGLSREQPEDPFDTMKQKHDKVASHMRMPCGYRAGSRTLLREPSTTWPQPHTHTHSPSAADVTFQTKLPPPPLCNRPLNRALLTTCALHPSRYDFLSHPSPPHTRATRVPHLKVVTVHVGPAKHHTLVHLQGISQGDKQGGLQAFGACCTP